MAGLLKANLQLGDSATATQNFTLTVPATPDGTVKLARGNAGATTQDILTVDASGVVRANQGINLNSQIVETGGAGVGYGTGSGGTVTQATSKSTSVTLNKPTGQITMNNAALAAGASAQFRVDNSVVSSSDVVIPSVGGTGFNGSYTVSVVYCISGAFALRLTNTSAVSLSEAVVINFAIIKGATA